MVRQEWNKWDIDMVFPMNYNDFYLQPAEWVGEVTAEEVASVPDKPVMPEPPASASLPPEA